MSNRPCATDRAAFGVGLCVVSIAAIAGCKQSAMPGPQPDIVKADIKVDLPGVPAFDLPAVSSDGSHSVKEMRVRGRKLLDTDVSIRGFVTWAYDCGTAIKQAGWTDLDVEKAINDDPTKCQRPKFYLGDSADTSAEKSIWVVDVPRAPLKVEIANLPKEEIKNWPPVPPYKVGDEIIVTGKWSQSSAHSERNIEGLMVYTKLRNVTQNWETPPPVPVVPAPGAVPPGGKAPPKH
jgi:hypothetical protein